MTAIVDSDPVDRSLLRIAIVDDEPLHAKAIVGDLSARGFGDVSVVREAEEIVRSFRKYDVLLLDLDLGDVDGIEVVERVLAEQPDKWIFVISGKVSFLRRFDRREIRVKGVFEKLNVQGVYEKPLHPEVMDELIREADQLARKRQRIVSQVNAVVQSLGEAAHYSDVDVIAAQRGLALSKEGFRKYFVPTSRMRAARSGPSARRAIVVLLWTALQRLSFVPSEAFNLSVPKRIQLEALAECVEVLAGRGLTTEDEDYVDRRLWEVDLWPGPGRALDWEGAFALDQASDPMIEPPGVESA